MASNTVDRTTLFRVSQFVMLLGFISYVEAQTCVFYAGARDASPQYNIPNCTWHRQSACCKRTEVSAVMDSMFKIHETTKACKNRLHYMMCYFCSPRQIDWYDNGKVFICQEFCEETYEECATAKLGDKVLGEEYSSGKELCEAQSFQVVPSRERCFNFDPDAFDAATHGGLSILLAVVSLVAVVFLGR